MNFLRTSPGDEPVILEAYYNAPPARVFRAWTEPEEVMAWFGPAPDCMLAADIDLRVGGKWRFELRDGNGKSSFLEGTYLAIEADRRLVFSWSHISISSQGDREATPHSTVSLTLEPQGGGTRLHLRHEGILKRDPRLGVGSGWSSSLHKLAEHIGTEKE